MCLLCELLLWDCVALGALGTPGGHLSGQRLEDIPFPFDLEKLYLFELYKRDVRLFSDLPRLILLAMVFARQTGSRIESLAGLLATGLAASVSLLRHRRALFAEAFKHFDHVTMEELVD
ncbi:unnamed protein product [Symbiodinium sp. CCMP2456]|nr:unnamed protein product [Symbiodinium sp. CCMP2456]